MGPVGIEANGRQVGKNNNNPKSPQVIIMKSKDAPTQNKGKIKS